MFTELLDQLTSLLGHIATLGKDRRELKDLALKAVSTALNETTIYYRDLGKSTNRNLEREAMLVKYWSAAAIPLRHFDQSLAEICEHKAEYWLNPDSYSSQEIEELGIRLDSVRDAYRRILIPRFGRYR